MIPARGLPGKRRGEGDVGHSHEKKQGKKKKGKRVGSHSLFLYSEKKEKRGGPGLTQGKAGHSMFPLLKRSVDLSPT